MPNYKFVVKDIQGNVIYKSLKSYDKVDLAQKEGQKHMLNSSYSPGCNHDVLPINKNL